MFYSPNSFWKAVVGRICVLAVSKSDFFKGVEDPKCDKAPGSVSGARSDLSVLSLLRAQGPRQPHLMPASPSHVAQTAERLARLQTKVTG